MKTVNSKVNKLAEIQTLTEFNTCDILCVSETWLDNKIFDSTAGAWPYRVPQSAILFTWSS